MALSLDQVKSFLRVETDEDDNLLTAQMTAAVNYLKGQISKTKVTRSNETKPIEDDELFQHAVKLMVAHWYENREIQSGRSLSDVAHTVDAIVQHIEVCGDYS